MRVAPPSGQSGQQQQTQVQQHVRQLDVGHQVEALDEIDPYGLVSGI